MTIETDIERVRRYRNCGHPVMDSALELAAEVERMRKPDPLTVEITKRIDSLSDHDRLFLPAAVGAIAGSPVADIIGMAATLGLQIASDLLPEEEKQK